MGVLEDLADKLAQDTLQAAEELGDETLVTRISEELGASSQTTQEAFNTAIRMRRAERRAREVLEARIAKARTTDP